MKGFEGNPPKNAILVAVFASTQETWELYLRGSRDQVISYKLCASGRRVVKKANYWFMWHVSGRNIVNKGRDCRLLQSHRPALYDLLKEVLDDIQGEYNDPKQITRGLERGIQTPIYRAFKNSGASESEAVTRGMGAKFPPYVQQRGNCPHPSTARTSTQYFTGVPCKRGHVANRRSRDGECMECRRIANREYRERKRVEDLL